MFQHGGVRAVRLGSDGRKRQILEVAVKLAEKYGYTKVTRDLVADFAGVSGPVVSYHFGNVDRFRQSIMRYAIDTENLCVIAQGLSVKDPTAIKIPDNLKQRAVRALID